IAGVVDRLVRLVVSEPGVGHAEGEAPGARRPVDPHADAILVARLKAQPGAGGVLERIVRRRIPDTRADAEIPIAHGALEGDAARSAGTGAESRSAEHKKA